MLNLCLGQETQSQYILAHSPEPRAQTSFTLELTHSGDSFAIQPTSGHRRIT